MNDNKTETKTTTAGTSNTYTWYYSAPKQGWECPRCGTINAPWVSQCNCNRGYWSPNWTWTSDHVDIDWNKRPDWWKEVTCGDDNIMNNHTTYTTAYNNVGGSDYSDGCGGYTNVTKNYTNKVK